MHMKFSMTGQEKGDLLIQVTTWGWLSAFNIMKGKLKQSQSTIPATSTKCTITSHFKSLNTKNTSHVTLTSVITNTDNVHNKSKTKKILIMCLEKCTINKHGEYHIKW
jgi:ABC-type oligopeptide transport system substrate-binding subunit